MARTVTSFVCQACGAVAPKWSGRCDACDGWNTLAEEAPAAPVSGSGGAALPRGRASRLVGLKGAGTVRNRIETGIGELDRVAGGGFVPNSGVLIGGDPGIGKSTLLLQALASLAERRPARRLCHRRGGHRPGAPAGRTPRARRRAGPARRRNQASPTSSPPCRSAARCRPWWSSTPSRRYGRRQSSRPPPAPCRSCAPAPRR
jgi:hypothetical protein